MYGSKALGHLLVQVMAIGNRTICRGSPDSVFLRSAHGSLADVDDTVILKQGIPAASTVMMLVRWKLTLRYEPTYDEVHINPEAVRFPSLQYDKG